MVVFVITNDYDCIEAVMSTEEKAKIYCSIHEECWYEPHEVDEFEIGAEQVELFAVYEIFINFLFDVVRVEYSREKLDYKAGIHLQDVPTSFKLDMGKENYFCEMYIPKSEQVNADDTAKELINKEKARLKGV